MKEIIRVLEIVREIIENNKMDLSYSTYESKEHLINDINEFINKLKHNDFSCVKEISLLFAPTGDLQEISMESGWSDEYIKLSETIDRYIK